MVELADTADLKSASYKSAGSSPAPGTISSKKLKPREKGKDAYGIMWRE